MKAMICEMCGSNDLIKKDGVYVCQHCNTKYTVDEAKKLFTDVTEQNPLPVRVVKTEETANYVQLATDAYDASRYNEADEYAKKALENNPDDPLMWLVRMKCAFQTASLYMPKYNEIISFGNNAIEKSGNDPDWINQVRTIWIGTALGYLTISAEALADLDSVRKIRDFYKAALK